MEKEIRTSVKYAMTAREIWVDLKERFGKVSAPRAYELKRSLTFTKQDGTSVSAYYTKLRGIWDEIQSVLPVPRCTCSGCDCDIGKKLQQLRDKERLYEFLLGLDAEYGTIRTQILAMNPVPSLGNAYHLVAEDEQQRAIAGTKRPSSDSVAFQAQVTAKRDQSRPKQKDVKRSSSKPVGNCTNCGKDGHNRDGCFELIGYPDWWPGKGKQDKAKPSAACVDAEKSPIAGLSDSQYQQFLKFFGNKEGANAEESGPKANLAGNIDKEGKWIVDSGATEHITHNDSLLKNKRKRGYEQPVTIPNGEAVPVEGRGECALPSGAIITEIFVFPKKWDDEDDLDDKGLNQTRPNDNIDEPPSSLGTEPQKTHDGPDSSGPNEETNEPAMSGPNQYEQPHPENTREPVCGDQNETGFETSTYPHH
ncbi:GAG-pre-integrase domain, Gag-polypeptide of LTR copia-type [Artemisia annua]|uniref:GAG-pre-integrase domain, Gag-polypeptide of LTR copia-type n=1 Tax=Artemisia annua TaxID=35608 RepID=A0A2U1PA89_ARTAN|nr:GAG-pre-integrase domain, Gag-polypeptide of LTR copia-type [Artemisia annua]